MKTNYALSLLLGTTLAIGIPVRAQVVTPDLAPFATITQTVGSEEIKIDYSRPSVRERMVFGELVPYGKVWSVGANASTKILVREELTVQDGKKLAPGVYAMYAIPGTEEWTIIFSRYPWFEDIFGYSSTFDALRVNVKPEKLKEQVETFTIQFANVCSSCAEIQLLWDLTKVSFRVSTNADVKAMTDIKKFTSNPEARLGGDYYVSAKYYLDTDRDLNQAMEWIDKALKYSPGAYWMTHTKAEIYAKMGNYNEAIRTAKLSIEEAKVKKDEDYIRINDLDIAKWKDLKKNKSGS